VNTEITDTKEVVAWVLYDAECPFCVRWARRFQNILAARHFVLVPLQTPWVLERLKTSEPELRSEMRLLKLDGSLFGGADALLELCRYNRLTWPIHKLGKIPAVTKILRAGYRRVARNRNCLNGDCKIGKPSKKIVFLELP
jgi:predicted DCC family thiol-disulfide oxidoreductase YuxK